MCEDLTEKYKYMIEAFECDYNLVFDDPFGLAYLTQSLKRLKENKKLTNKDKKLLEDIELLRELSFVLRHKQAKIVSCDK